MSFISKKNALKSSIACVAGGLLLAGCASMSSGDEKAVAQLEPTRGNAVTGTVSFKDDGGKVLMVAKVDGLKPGQEQGFHLHEKGDCSSGDGLSAGGHFNPGNQPHGPQSAPHHAGDLPALKADAKGHAELRVELEGVTVKAGPTSVVGRGLIVHANADDYATQPTGNAGGRVACAVVALKS